MLIIITSAEEKFNDGAKKIKFESEFFGMPCKIFVFSPNKTKDKPLLYDISNEDFVYFLTNNIQVIKFFIPFLLSKKCFIVNKKFLQNLKSKLEMQEMIKKIGVLVPNNLPLNQIKGEIMLKGKVTYPAFIKNKCHCMPMIKIKNEDAFVSCFKKIKKPNEWYVEENVTDSYCSLQKFYFTFDKVASRGNITRKINKQIITALRDISKILKLDTFSADFIVKEYSKVFWCIDVNPASAFFNCNKARKNFIKLLGRTFF